MTKMELYKSDFNPGPCSTKSLQPSFERSKPAKKTQEVLKTYIQLIQAELDVIAIDILIIHTLK